MHRLGLCSPAAAVASVFFAIELIRKLLVPKVVDVVAVNREWVGWTQLSHYL